MSDLWLTLPDGTVELPLQSDQAARQLAVEHLLDGLRAISPAPPEHLAGTLTTMADQLTALGVRLLGQFVVDTADGPEVATVAVGCSPLEPPAVVPEGAFAEAAIEALVADVITRRPYGDTRAVDLPGGPAVASIVLGEYRIPPAETLTGEEIVVPTFRAEFLLPTPTWDAIVVLDVTTTSGTAWPDVSVAAVSTARSVSFDAGAPAGRRLTL